MRESEGSTSNVNGLWYIKKLVDPQLNSEIAVNRSLPSSEKIGRTSSKNGKSKGKINEFRSKTTQRNAKSKGAI